MQRIFPILTMLLYLLVPAWLRAEDGYRLWLRYDAVADAGRLAQYRQQLDAYRVVGNSPTANVIREELALALPSLLAQGVAERPPETERVGLLIATAEQSASIRQLGLSERLQPLGQEGYLLLNRQVNGRPTVVITANADIGLLYGTFHLLRLLQMQQQLDTLDIASAPKIDLRMLNHWDNLDRTVERGYAGFSIWDWHRLPDYLDPRYRDYARANASVGINATVLTNVNANALVLRPDYLDKVKALADLFRPYGIRVYLTARFSAPIELGRLKTADPLDPAVQQWWKAKADEIYARIPDFGGFLVKANSEGQPGPQNYGRNHAEGANLLADAVAPHGGIVIWRAFVYSDEEPEDRVKQAFNEFVPLDGKFRDNVVVQVKNGPLDFQPREPIHPLFGAMPQTVLAMEFQITQEYLGQGTNLVYLAPMYEEVLDFDTYARGPGSTVAQVIDGSLENHDFSVMAGVANIGNDRNWTGHLFGQSNWYAFGRLAWDPYLSSEKIGEEWLRMTFTNEAEFLQAIKPMLLASYEACVQYMTPLGLHHIMGANHHYGPGPWVDQMSRADWTSVYYHRADSAGLGFDRTPTGSDASSQYFPPVAERFASREQCPEKYLLWFHHVGWNERLESGETLWNELVKRYYTGAAAVEAMQVNWRRVAPWVDAERHKHVDMLLTVHAKEARWWRDACVLYFQTFSGQPIPADLPSPEHTLEHYRGLSHPYAPGIRPQW